ncbi:unnamed protein product [Rhizoctonia solani]|uniref:Uncharacterized protein n=1 Tax=Rhizoctonia solani TaxID=456999 RepID=A0A8H2XY83_9AGAM|nr:unnamed protein product [Rhizoctonia solani]
MAPGKIALPTSPKLESQPLEPDVSRTTATKRLLKGAALGTAAWFIITSALGAGPAWEHERFGSWGRGRPHRHGWEHPADCSVWEDFDFDAPLRFGEGRHPHRHVPPPRPPPPGAPMPPPPPHGPHGPHGAHPQVYNLSSSAVELRFASIGFLGSGLLRVEPAAEDVDTIQAEVRGAHGRVCVLKGEDGEDVGLGLVGYMRGRGRHGERSKAKGWWWKRHYSKDGHCDSDSNGGEDNIEFVDRDVSMDSEYPYVSPEEDYVPPPPGHRLPPPPGGRMPPPPPPPPGPPAPPPPPLPLLRLKTRLPLFTHDLALTPSSSSSLEIESEVPTFGGLDLQTREAPVLLGSVVVSKGYNATVHSRNAPIRGDLSLLGGWAELETKNAKVDVGLSARSGGVDVKTSNSPIIATLELQKGKEFNTSFFTTNGHLTVNVTALPTGSKLFLDAQTSNAPASVQLHPAYEGTFELASSIVAPAVVVGEEQEGRKIQFEREGRHVKGSIWREEDVVREGGKVVVSTSNALNVLLL